MKKLVSLAVLAFFVAVPQCLGVGPPDLVEICHLLSSQSEQTFTPGIIISVPVDSPAAVIHMLHGDCDGIDISSSDGIFCECGGGSSSRRFKEDIRDMDEASDGLMQLRPVMFRYKADHAQGERPLQPGLIAEEVAETFPELAVLNDDGQPETVKYRLLAPLLLNEVQKLESAGGEKDARIDELDKEVQKLEARLAALEAENKARDARFTAIERLLGRAAPELVSVSTAARSQATAE